MDLVLSSLKAGGWRPELGALLAPSSLLPAGAIPSKLGWVHQRAKMPYESRQTGFAERKSNRLIPGINAVGQPCMELSTETH
ncbi:hypothetical protein BO82DRAFT_358885, partial [Aspergillus uvarum CBS 121591]